MFRIILNAYSVTVAWSNNLKTKKLNLYTLCLHAKVLHDTNSNEWAITFSHLEGEITTGKSPQLRNTDIEQDWYCCP